MPVTGVRCGVVWYSEEPHLIQEYIQIFKKLNTLILIFVCNSIIITNKTPQKASPHTSMGKRSQDNKQKKRKSLLLATNSFKIPQKSSNYIFQPTIQQRWIQVKHKQNMIGIQLRHYLISKTNNLEKLSFLCNQITSKILLGETHGKLLCSSTDEYHQIIILELKLRQGKQQTAPAHNEDEAIQITNIKYNKAVIMGKPVN